MKKRALISVSDKQNITAFAQGLSEVGYEIISTGGTLRTIKEAGIEAQAVEEITGFPEIMDGRVKTLHPAIHGGLLGKRLDDEHKRQMEENNIEPIDMVVVNLYPFKETLAKPDASKEEMIENIDIGGPAMLRSAAKNFENVTVVVDPADYDSVLADVREDQMTNSKRQQLAAKTFRHTAAYDALVSQYFTSETSEAFPENYTFTYEKVQSLRYGENPHQEAAFYRQPLAGGMSMQAAEQLHGKALSYNNIQDGNAALEILAEYEQSAAVAVKHMNPCGIGVGENLAQAFAKAYAADPVSIFGGIVALNREIDLTTAEKLSGIFLEIIIAPGFSEEAFERLSKKKNIRLLQVEMGENTSQGYKLTDAGGGVLIQSRDEGKPTAENLQTMTKRKPTDKEIDDLLFAQKAVKHVKSNAIVLAKDSQTIGVGAGQMNRVGAAQIAIEQAGEKAEGSVMASDAFLPMPDTVEAAARAGVSAIIQPGGSKKDQESIDVCDMHGIAMVYTGMRHFKH